MKIKKESILLLFLTLSAVLLAAFSEKAKSGALHGLETAVDVIVPSLLPLLIIFNLISKSDAGTVIENILAPVTEKVFRLPRAAGGAVFFGLTGGYPTGALLTESLYLNDDIDSETAKRLLRFNVNGGAAFIITGVGTGILNSKKAGLILFTASTLSALLIAFFSSFHYEKTKEICPCRSSVPFGDALNKSTECSVKAVLNISAYIILFSAFCNILSVPAPLAPLLEITSGVADHFRLFPLPILCAMLSFAGLCVHFQLFSVIKKIGMRYFDFFIWRVAHSVLSYAVCYVLVRMFPEGSAVFSNSAENIAVPFSVNLTLSVLMIFGCAVIVLDIESRKRKC